MMTYFESAMSNSVSFCAVFLWLTVLSCNVLGESSRRLKHRLRFNDTDGAGGRESVRDYLLGSGGLVETGDFGSLGVVKLLFHIDDRHVVNCASGVAGGVSGLWSDQREGVCPGIYLAKVILRTRTLRPPPAPPPTAHD